MSRRVLQTLAETPFWLAQRILINGLLVLFTLRRESLLQASQQHTKDSLAYWILQVVPMQATSNELSRNTRTDPWAILSTSKTSELKVICRIHTSYRIQLTLLGDGVTDDTSAFQSALNAGVGKIIHVDAGTYLITRTVTVPAGTKLVGETWSQIAAYGPFFSDPNNPKVVLKVGAPGQVGDVEMQDLMFTTKGPTAGAILVEWNMKQSKPGSAGIWGMLFYGSTSMNASLTLFSPQIVTLVLVVHQAPSSILKSVLLSRLE